MNFTIWSLLLKKRLKREGQLINFYIKKELFQFKSEILIGFRLLLVNFLIFLPFLKS